jgi:hypothetical protein
LLASLAGRIYHDAPQQNAVPLASEGQIVSEAAMVKVLLQEEDRVETLWAVPVGSGLYRLDNSPFWAYGVSWNDVVEARPDSDGMLRMERVVEKAGHRTIRVLLPRDEIDEAQARALLNRLKEFGASYEGLNPAYIAVDIPPAVELSTITHFLTEQEIEWEHADPTHDEIHDSE